METYNQESPERLKVLAFNVTTSGENKLLHRIILENSHPEKSMNVDYLRGIFHSLTSDLPVNCLNDEGFTALHLAVKRRHCQMVEIMVSCIYHLDINAKTGDNETAMNLAVKSKQLDMIRTLLHLRAKVNEGGYEENSPLHYAVENNSLEIVQLLLDNGCDINPKNERGKTPLHSCKSLDVGKLLIFRGADMNALDGDGCTPFYKAVMGERLEFAKYLLEQGVEIDGPMNNSHTTLHIVCIQAYDCDKLVEFLIANGANVNAKTMSSYTPLHFASSEGRRNVVELLLRNGAEVDSRNDINRTPLHQAISSMIGSDKHAKSFEKYNRSYKEVIELLVLNGADVNASDNGGNSPLSIAKAKNPDILNLLNRKKRKY